MRGGKGREGWQWLTGGAPAGDKQARLWWALWGLLVELAQALPLGVHPPAVRNTGCAAAWAAGTHLIWAPADRANLPVASLDDCLPPALALRMGSRKLGCDGSLL